MKLNFPLKPNLNEDFIYNLANQNMSASAVDLATGQAMAQDILVYNKEIARLKELTIEWHEGRPKAGFLENEWFLAETKHGDRVVLKALPEEYTYDFKTADDTYISKNNIIKWALFPDSEWEKEYASIIAEVIK